METLLQDKDRDQGEDLGQGNTNVRFLVTEQGLVKGVRTKPFTSPEFQRDWDIIKAAWSRCPSLQRFVRQKSRR